MLKDKPFSGYLRSLPNGLGVISKEYIKVKNIIEYLDKNNQIPHDGKFLWSNKFETAQDESGNFIEYRQTVFPFQLSSHY